MKKKKSKKKLGIAASKYPKTKREYMDYDYFHSLPDDAKEILLKFNEEYYQGYFKKKNKKYDKPLHDNQELRRDCYNRNNANNRDLYSIFNSTLPLENIDGLTKQNTIDLHGMGAFENAYDTLQSMLELGFVTKDEYEELLELISR
jgi:hypothetical protein